MRLGPIRLPVISQLWFQPFRKFCGSLAVSAGNQYDLTISKFRVANPFPVDCDATIELVDEVSLTRLGRWGDVTIIVWLLVSAGRHNMRLLVFSPTSDCVFD